MENRRIIGKRATGRTPKKAYLAIAAGVIALGAAVLSGCGHANSGINDKTKSTSGYGGERGKGNSERAVSRRDALFWVLSGDISMAKRGIRVEGMLNALEKRGADVKEFRARLGRIKEKTGELNVGERISTDKLLCGGIPQNEREEHFEYLSDAEKGRESIKKEFAILESEVVLLLAEK